MYCELKLKLYGGYSIVREGLRTFPVLSRLF
jgi:hypothetical protein